MGSSLGPKQIVTDGLVLHLDAGNRRSYPGSGTTWNDLSGNGNHGTLINGPTFDSGNVGNFEFDDINDFVECTNTGITNFQPTSPFSVFVWVYNLSHNGTSGAIVANMDHSGSVIPGWDLWVNLNNQISMHLISAWSGNAIKISLGYDYPQNVWKYIGYTYDGSCPTNSTQTLNSVNWYIDGILQTTGLQVNAGGFDSSAETITYTDRQSFRVSSRWSSGGTGVYAPSKMNMSMTQIYNKALSAEEVLQNYNATKERFTNK